MRLHRIFLVLDPRATSDDSNRIWIKNLYDPLVALGHDVFLFDIDKYSKQNGLVLSSEAARERLSNYLPVLFQQEHDKKPFDIFFSYLHTLQIIPEVLKQIKQKVFTINYSANFHQFDLFKEVARNVDCNIYISKIAKTGFDDIGVKSYWMPLAANPFFYKPSKQNNKNVVFIGSAYGNRPYLFWRLLQYGVNLHVYGNDWLENKKTADEVSFLKKITNSTFNKVLGFELQKKIHRTSANLKSNLRIQNEIQRSTIRSLIQAEFSKNLHASLTDEEYSNVIAEAGVAINIQESRFNHDYCNHQVLFGSNLRDFEATMSGTFLCTQYSEEIEELFEIDKEIICYHNEHDLADKIHFFNNNISQREEIANAGYQRAINFHTWEKRFNDLFCFINKN